MYEIREQWFGTGLDPISAGSVDADSEYKAGRFIPAYMYRSQAGRYDFSGLTPMSWLS
jgi:hypothetical protein